MERPLLVHAFAAIETMSIAAAISLQLCIMLLNARGIAGDTLSAEGRAATAEQASVPASRIATALPQQKLTVAVAEPAAVLQLPPPETLGVWQGLALAVAVACNAALRRFGSVPATTATGRDLRADAPARLAVAESLLSSQGEKVAELGRQLDKLQTRTRLVASDFRKPLQQVRAPRACRLALVLISFCYGNAAGVSCRQMHEAWNWLCRTP